MRIPLIHAQFLSSTNVIPYSTKWHYYTFVQNCSNCFDKCSPNFLFLNNPPPFKHLIRFLFSVARELGSLTMLIVGLLSTIIHKTPEATDIIAEATVSRCRQKTVSHRHSPHIHTGFPFLVAHVSYSLSHNLYLTFRCREHHIVGGNSYHTQYNTHDRRIKCCGRFREKWKSKNKKQRVTNSEYILFASNGHGVLSRASLAYRTDIIEPNKYRGNWLRVGITTTTPMRKS